MGTLVSYQLEGSIATITMDDGKVNALSVQICRQRLTPAHFNRAVVLAEVFSPDDAVAAGFLDRVVPASELRDVALSAADLLAKLDGEAHAASKRRARDRSLHALRAAIEADDADFSATA